MSAPTTAAFVEAHGDLDETLAIVRRAYWSLDDERQDTRSEPEARELAQTAHGAVLDLLTVLEDRAKALATQLATRRAATQPIPMKKAA